MSIKLAIVHSILVICFVQSIESYGNENLKFSVLNVTNAIKEGNFNRANQLIDSNATISSNDWRQIVAGAQTSSLCKFGESMSISTNKLMFYTQLKASIRSSYRPSSDFVKFENGTSKALGTLFLVAYAAERGDTAAAKSLEEIRWDQIVEAELSNNHRAEPKIQALLNQTILDHSHSYNVSRVIGRVKSIDHNSENKKVLKAFLYGALYNGINRIPAESWNLLSIAHAINVHIKNVRHDTGRSFFEGYLRRLADSFHGCVRSIVNGPKDFMIRNDKYGEYIYPEPFTLSLHLPTNFDRIGHRPILSRKSTDSQSKFLMDFGDTRYYVKNDWSSNVYLDTTDNLYAFGGDRHASKSALKIVPSNLDNQNCYILNWSSGHYMYASDGQVQTDRRFVFTNGTLLRRNQAYLWTFVPHKRIS